MKKIISILFLFNYIQTLSFSSMSRALYPKKLMLGSIVLGASWKCVEKLTKERYKREIESLAPFTYELFEEEQYVFDELKKYMGITETIHFRKIDSGKMAELAGGDDYPRAFYMGTKLGLFSEPYLYISSDLQWNIVTIFTLAHELHHHKQTYNYPGSYHGSDSVQKERDADQAAMKLFTNPSSIQELRNKKFGDCDNNPFQADLIASLTSKGYVGPKEYDAYRDSLLKENKDNNHPAINSCQAVFFRHWDRCSDPQQRGLSPDMIQELHEYRNKLKVNKITK